jgi:hypothetical protein
MSGTSLACRLTLCGLAVVALGASARGQTADAFFKGKPITLIIGYSPGGTYDVYARLAATLLPRYIPAIPPSCRGTCRAPAARRPPIFFTAKPRGMA